MGEEKGPALSIIVPIVNEAAQLPELFASLFLQREILFELLLCDGGSVDRTAEVAKHLGESAPFPVRWVDGERGRGRQMNAGAAVARGRTLLFLHADCRFPDPLALRRGLDVLQRQIAKRGNEQVAGRFSLRFALSGKNPSAAYAFYESKARLCRPGCIHGDQGFLLRPSFFREVGPFDESLPYLEDDRLAEEVQRAGEWILLPDVLVTSARRFESEGLPERQLLNALILNFNAIGWDSPLQAFPLLYRLQDKSRPLDLLPFLDGIQGLLDPLPLKERRRLWRSTGEYVLSNAWQIPLAFDCRRRGHEGRKNLCLTFHDRWGRRLLDHPPGKLAATALTWICFHLLRAILRRKRSSSISLEA